MEYCSAVKRNKVLIYAKKNEWTLKILCLVKEDSHKRLYILYDSIYRKCPG